MNTKIKDLLAQLEQNKGKESTIRDKLQKEYNKVFDDSKELEKVINNAQNANEYQTNRWGEIESWFRFSGLSDFEDCKEYFERWLEDTHCMQIDWEYETLLNSQGESFIVQDDTRNDNGVWYENKCIIKEDEYKEDGEVNETLRNELIEKHMEKTGFFPSVFKIDSHGNVSLINTKA